MVKNSAGMPRLGIQCVRCQRILAKSICMLFGISSADRFEGERNYKLSRVQERIYLELEVDRQQTIPIETSVIMHSTSSMYSTKNVPCSDFGDVTASSCNGKTRILKLKFAKSPDVPP